MYIGMMLNINISASKKGNLLSKLVFSNCDNICVSINVNNKQLSTILKILVPLDYPYEDSPNNSKINSITSSDLI